MPTVKTHLLYSVVFYCMICYVAVIKFLGCLWLNIFILIWITVIKWFQNLGNSSSPFDPAAGSLHSAFPNYSYLETMTYPELVRYLFVEYILKSIGQRGLDLAWLTSRELHKRRELISRLVPLEKGNFLQFLCVCLLHLPSPSNNFWTFRPVWTLLCGRLQHWKFAETSGWWEERVATSVLLKGSLWLGTREFLEKIRSNTFLWMWDFHLTHHTVVFSLRNCLRTSEYSYLL